MNTYIVCGSGTQRLQCGIDLDITVKAEYDFVNGTELVFTDRNGKVVSKFEKWTNYYLAGKVQNNLDKLDSPPIK